MSRVWAPLKRIGQLTLAVLAGTAFFAPALAVFASSKPAVALAMKRPHAVIAVHPFFDLGSDNCIDPVPIHEGPVERSGRVTWSLESRMRQAADRCLRLGTDDHFVLTMSVDAKGEIASVELDDDSDPHLTACVKSAVRRSIEPIDPGPVRIKVAYFMGRLKQHTAGLPVLLP